MYIAPSPRSLYKKSYSVDQVKKFKKVKNIKMVFFFQKAYMVKKSALLNNPKLERKTWTVKKLFKTITITEKNKLSM